MTIGRRSAARIERERAFARRRVQRDQLGGQAQLVAPRVPGERRRGERIAGTGEYGRAGGRARPPVSDPAPRAVGKRCEAASPVGFAEQQMEAAAVDVHKHVSGTIGTGSRELGGAGTARASPRRSAIDIGSPATTEMPRIRGSSKPTISMTSLGARVPSAS